jgi:glycosyltransferase involved in cell wall biosynthesis
MRELVLITGGFPFGKGEPFLETELPFLAEKFERITLVSINPRDGVERKTPENCSAMTLDTHLNVISKFKSLRYLFSSLFRQEMKIIRNTYNLKLNKSIITTILLSLFKAHKIQKVLSEQIRSKQTVFYSYWTDDAAIALALLKQKHPDVKTVCRAHRWDLYFHVNPLKYLPLRHFISEQMNAIYPVSTIGKSYIVDHWKIKEPNNIITARLGAKPQQKMAPSKEFMVASCSNLIPLKRVHLIIEALAQIKHIKIKWIHFGEGQEKERLIELAKKKLGANVIWEFKGAIPNADLLDWYKQNRPTVFINVSESEGIPVSIMEAMSFGIPCIATDVGGASEIVNNENGVLLSADARIKAIKEAILYFMDEKQREQRSRNAYMTWESNYNAQINYPLFVEEIAAL